MRCSTPLLILLLVAGFLPFGRTIAQPLVSAKMEIGIPATASGNYRPEADDTQEKGTFGGVVLNKDKQPLEGIAVYLKGTTYTYVTNADGAFSFTNLPAGTYWVVFASINVEPSSKVLTLLGGQSITWQVVLAERSHEVVSIEVTSTRSRPGTRHALGQLADTVGAAVYAGKKTEVLQLSDIDANLATNNARQIFAKVPGVHSWESDGSGVQVGVSTRGLSPNRSWEFNVRQNGYDISSDLFGYPEAYFNPPMEAVERIELVRGSASLQYGPQFGGLLNYVIKQAPKDKKLGFESVNTVGSYGLLNTHNAIGGTNGRWSYYGYANQRMGDGWRKNSRSNITNTMGQVAYQVNDKLRIGLDFTYMNYLNQQPGGLTEAQFAQDPQQSNRARNWFNINWLVPAVTADYTVSSRTKISVKAYGLVGQRNSVGYTAAITVPDTFNVAAKGFNARTIDRDWYSNVGIEARLLTNYDLLGQTHSLATGVKYYRGNTRRVQGAGSRLSDYDLGVTTPDYSRDLQFGITNFAAFAENVFRLSTSTTITPGIRVERITNTSSGRLARNFTTGVDQSINDDSKTRTFVLAGLGLEQRLLPNISLYANASQAYRPVLFSDVTPPSTTDVIDANLKDATGYNLDAGLRGSVSNWLSWDVSYYYLNYANRIGNLAQLNDNGSSYVFRTNLGTTTSTGLEAYGEIDFLALAGQDATFGNLSAFASVASIDARYQDFKITSVVAGAVTETNLKGNRVENAPNYIGRYGLRYSYHTVSVTWQYSQVSSQFTDATNTQKANVAATIGEIPAYSVQDLSASYQFLASYSLKAGVNNLTDAKYYTRRSGGYPGPGILPADGRTWYVTFGIKL
jgi:Fe(3+) dicitrate transport protein